MLNITEMYVLYIHSHREPKCSQQVREKGWRNEKDHIPTVDSDGDAGGEFAPPVPLTLAQTTNPTPQTRVVETRTEPDRTGLWGLLGLAGLLGLTGLGRRREDVRSLRTP